MITPQNAELLNEFLSMSDREKRMALNMHRSFKESMDAFYENNHRHTYIGHSQCLVMDKEPQEDTCWDHPEFADQFDSYQKELAEIAREELSSTWGLPFEDELEERITAEF